MRARETLLPPSVGRAGKVEDRPWGATLAALGISGRTCELTLRGARDAVHRIAFVHGAVVGATSPVAADAVARVAVSTRLVTAAQVAAFARDRRRSRTDELAAFVDAMALVPEQVQELKTRVLVQRAARTFAIDRGDFTIEAAITIPLMIGIGVDVRTVIYHGARLVLDGARLTAGVRKHGSRFVLSAGDADLARFGFADAERAVIDALRAGTSPPEIEARHRELDPRMVEAVIYALAACGAVTASESAEEPRVTQPPARVPDEMQCVPMRIGSDPFVARPANKPGAAGAPRLPTVAATPIALGRGTKRWTEPFLEVLPTVVRPNALTASEVRGLITAGRTMLGRSVDHFTMLGLPIGASVDAVRTSYVELARNLRPERLTELRIRDRELDARALLAQVTIAFTVLTDPARRAEYIAGLRRSGVRGAEALDFAKLAAEAYQRGKRALRADEPELAIAELRTACELAPDDRDYIATLGQAEFCVRMKTR
ncbi:MAG: J domain-containing protein [Deltaproteobacteria bacterium]